MFNARLALIGGALAAVALATPSASANPPSKCAQDHYMDQMSGDPNAMGNFQECMSGNQDPNDYLRGLVCAKYDLSSMPACFVAHLVWP